MRRHRERPADAGAAPVTMAVLFFQGSTEVGVWYRDVERRFLLFVAASTVFMAAILLLDRDGLQHQLAFGLATAGFVWLFARRSRVEPRQILCAILVATAGEIVLSLGWGLYSYEHALIPLYVPPGHGLFYLLAADTAQQEALRRRGPAITRAVLVIGSAIALVSLVGFGDVWGLVWWIGAVLLIRKSKNALLLSACFVYTILLEWAGTAIGNWQWTAIVPFVGLRSANPPAGVGILYILLDLITVALAAKVGSWQFAVGSGEDRELVPTRAD